MIRFGRHSILFSVLLGITSVVGLLGSLIFLHRLEPPGSSIAVHGAMDATGHILTALVAAVGVRALRLPVPVVWICVGAVVLDLGHLLGWMGVLDPLQGSSRNGSHSLAVVVVLACAGFLDQRRAALWLGIAIGASTHLWRDMGTGTIALLWPISETVYGTTFTRYIAVVGGVAIAMIGSSALLAVDVRARPSS